MVVKGARKPRSARAALLQPFAPVMVSWRGKGELKTVHGIEPVQSTRLLGNHLYCGFYINELMLRAVMPGQSAEGLFELYSSVISRLATQSPVQPCYVFLNYNFCTLPVICLVLNTMLTVGRL